MQDDLTQPESSHEPVNQTPTLILGNIAKTVAHDFKNMVMTIQGNAELALRRPNLDYSTRQSLERIMMAAEASSSLADQILKFSSGRAIQKKAINLCRIVRELKQLLEATTPRTIQLDFRTPADPVFVMADATQLRQLLMNLCVNGIQAMHGRMGELSVQLSAVGSSASITVNDCGKGISAEKLKEIFDPVYTTKEFGAGHGLGLAIAKRIVDSHQGHIEVASEVGKGARFLVRLETCAPPDNADELTRETQKMHRGLRLLYVDDEPAMRSLGRDMLQMLGHDVIVAENGAVALKLIEEEPRLVDMVLTDSKMPEMTGTELALRLRAVNRSLPVLMVTAFNRSMTLQDMREANLEIVVSKPFMLDDLRNAIDAVADRCGLR